MNYQFGRVQILDESLLASDVPIQISTESNALFGQQTKRFTGLNVENLILDQNVEFDAIADTLESSFYFTNSTFE